MPTSQEEDEVVEEIYEKIEEQLKSVKGTEYVIVMGDWNSVIGEGEEGKEIGKYGLGERNDRGSRLAQFCKENKLMITYTWFKQPRRRRYTWKQPGDMKRYQIDYLMVRQRYRNSVINAKSYPGADLRNAYCNAYCGCGLYCGLSLRGL